jgi:hypothetical protein
MKTETRERPILFSAPMVRAILAGRKTQTRRVVKPQPLLNYPGIENHCPYGQPGDQLWVRESFRYFFDEAKLYDCIQYSADGTLYKPSGLNWETGMAFSEKCEPPYKMKPSIHMPRWVSRINLEITGVQVERVRDISDDDALAEGVDTESDDCAWAVAEKAAIAGVPIVGGSQERFAFANLWDSINAARGCGWEMNPWVWVIEFRSVENA